MPLLAEDLRSLFASMTVAALTIAALALGRDILIPLAVATVIAFILGPVVRRLVSWRVPESLAVAAILGSVIALVVTLSLVFSAQMLELAASAGTYRTNIVEKARTVSGIGREDGILKRASDAIDSLGAALEQELTPASAHHPGAGKDGEKQVVVAPSRNFLEQAAALTEPLAKIALTLLFAVFLLLQYQDLRDRIVRIAGADNLSGTTAAMSDAGTRLSRLFFAQAVLNVGFGVVIAIALWIIGLPNPVLWGALTALMRFVPFIGSFISAIPPILLAAAVDPSWGMASATLMLFAIGEPLMGHVVEPLVLGRQIGLSPFAMIVAASFWTLIWGPIGLLLAAPLTMLLVVMGRYIPALEIFSIILGDQPALSADQEFYGRVLSADSAAAVELIGDAIEESSIAAASDDIVLPALRLAALDYRRGKIDSPRLAELRETLVIVGDAMSERDAESIETPCLEQRPTLTVIPARGPVDLLTAEYIATMLTSQTRWRIEAGSGSTGLTAISAFSAGERSSSAEAVLVVTVGGVDPRHLDIILHRARRAFAHARLMTYETEPMQRGTAKRNAIEVNRYTQLAQLVNALAFIPASTVRDHATDGIDEHTARPAAVS